MEAGSCDFDDQLKLSIKTGGEMPMRLERKVAVITGAGSGVGRATAKLFAAEGAQVVCADVSGEQDSVATEIGDVAIAVHSDVAKEDDVRDMIATAEKYFGRLGAEHTGTATT
jgi:NAD(P)-dependent dehydrogenase (short-subunit alcohol dehydrogenase family)